MHDNNTYTISYHCCALLKIIIISHYIISHNFVAFHIVCIYFHKLMERLCVRCVRACVQMIALEYKSDPWRCWLGQMDNSLSRCCEKSCFRCFWRQF